MTDFKVGDRVMLNQDGAGFVRMIDDMKLDLTWHGWSGVLTYGSCGMVTTRRKASRYSSEPVFGVTFDAGGLELLLYPEQVRAVEAMPVKPRPAGRRVMLNRVGNEALRLIEYALTRIGPSRHTVIPQRFGDLGTAIAYEEDGHRVRVLFDNEPAFPCWVNDSWLDVVGQE